MTPVLFCEPVLQAFSLEGDFDEGWVWVWAWAQHCLFDGFLEAELRGSLSRGEGSASFEVSQPILLRRQGSAWMGESA